MTHNMYGFLAFLSAIVFIVAQTIVGVRCDRSWVWFLIALFDAAAFLAAPP